MAHFGVKFRVSAALRALSRLRLARTPPHAELNARQCITAHYGHAFLVKYVFVFCKSCCARASGSSSRSSWVWWVLLLLLCLMFLFCVVLVGVGCQGCFGRLMGLFASGVSFVRVVLCVFCQMGL